jgi:hypothetical protein
LKDAIMEQQEDGPDFSRFDMKAIANGFPDTPSCAHGLVLTHQ